MSVNFLTLFRPQMLSLSEDVVRAGDFLAKAAIRAVEHPTAPPLQGLEVPDQSSFRTGPDAGLKPAS